MSLLAELKRRNVFRVGAAYAVVGWLLIEVADTIFPRLGLPDWTVTLVIALALLGFPLALLLSWAYELTPEGVKRTEEVAREESVTPKTGRRIDRLIVIGLLGVIVLLVAERLWFAGADAQRKTADAGAVAVGNGAVSERAASPSVPVPTEPTIAVLPFANLSSDAENAYFADGLTEEVLNWLAKVPGLKVTGRTSSFYFKDRNEDLRSIGSQLGVAHVLEGSVRKAGNRLRITAQLIEVDDGFHLWSDTFDRELTDIFAIQDEIARAIVEALKLELGAAQTGTRPATESLPAYERLLEARTLIARRGAPGLQRAIVLLDEAVRLDPEFAAAWGALAQAYSLVHYYDLDMDRPAALARAEAAAQRALQLDPEQVSAHQALADVLRDRYRWLEAEASYRRALELNPNDVETNSQYGQMLGRLGHFKRGLPLLARAMELDPLAPVPPTFHGAFLVLTGAQAAGLAQLQHARALAPELGFILLVDLSLRIDLGDLESARVLQGKVGEWLRAEFPNDPLAQLDEVLAEHADDPATVLAHLRQALSYPKPLWGVAGWLWAAHYGDPALALRLMRAEQRVIVVQDSIWAWLPGLASMRRLPGFTEYASELNMPGYWRQRGWPDDCRPLAGDDFECGVESGP